MNTTDHLPLIERIGSQKLKRMTGMLLALPTIVIVSIIGIYFGIWRTDPLIRFSHMLWVLGFWTIGTLAMFAVMIRVQLRHGLSIPLLMPAFVSILPAIYFIPLSRFTNLFTSSNSLILPAAVGILNVVKGWLCVLRLRKRIFDTSL